MAKTTKWILVSSLNSEAPKMSAEFDTEEELNKYVEHESFLNPDFFPINRIEVPVAKEEYDFSSFNDNPFKNDDELLLMGTFRLCIKNKTISDNKLEQFTIINDKDRIDKEWEEFTKQDPANDLQFQEMEEAGFKRALYSSKIRFENLSYKILIPFYPHRKEDPFDAIIIIRKKTKAESDIENEKLSDVKITYSDMMNDIYNEFSPEFTRLLTEQIEKM